MKTSIRNAAKALAAAVLTTSAGFAHAVTATANLSVTASITSSCTISAPTAVAFGNYDPVSGVNSTATGAVGAACPAYGAGTAWTNLIAGGLTITAPPGKAARSFNVCGQIAAGQDASVGSYTDTVVATINF